MPRTSGSRIRPTSQPVKVPRWTFQLTYIGYVVFGIYALIVGTPTLDFSTPGGYVPLWAAALIVSAVVSAVGVTFDARRIEMWAVLALSSFFLAYVYAIGNRALTGDPNALAIAVILLVTFIFPASRFLVLTAKVMRA